MQKAKIGLIGLAVMGANLARNLANKEYEYAESENRFNRTGGYGRQPGP